MAEQNSTRETENATSLFDNLLATDFGQCFEQMRYYDESFRKTLEFSFGGVASTIAASAAFLGQYGMTSATTQFVGLLLLVASFASLLLVFFMARNRVYFAIVARFVNEIRKLYLDRSPGGFGNKSRIYESHKLPRIFDPGSTQTFQLLFLSVCNSFLFAGAVTFFHISLLLRGQAKWTLHWYAPVSAGVVFLSCEFGSVLRYWQKREGRRSANHTVFGR